MPLRCSNQFKNLTGLYCPGCHNLRVNTQITA
ncbi:MAG: DUF2752 domain-containing protein, partial [Halieaceae bacterium]|nr:DUF2752 domain-containing protein [Halieaceae bacterium]